MLFNIHSLKTQIKNEQEDKISNMQNHIRTHQIRWNDAFSRLERAGNEISPSVYIGMMDLLCESINEYKTVRYIGMNDSEMPYTFNTYVLYGQYESTLINYRDLLLKGNVDALDEFMNSDLFYDLRIINDWLNKRYINNNFEVYGDDVFKDEVYGRLKTYLIYFDF